MSSMSSHHMTFKEIEHSGWNKLAKNYDQFTGSFSEQAVKPTLDLAGVASGTRVLDVACGTGILSAGAAGRGAIPLGIDFAEAMVATARARHPTLNFEPGDAENLRFESHTFEAVVCGFGMLHFADPQRAIQ